MAKASIQYICQSCGSVASKWAGKCDGCGEWNSMTEEVANDTVPKGLTKAKGRTIETFELSGVSEKAPRNKTGIEEFDRVTGGGLVPGSALLIGGDPGIGKSTLLLQVICSLSNIIKTAYISGEESVDQVRMRAARLGLEKSPVELASSTNVRDIITTMKSGKWKAVVIDSIQTMYIDNIESAPGTVSQVRACSAELIRVAKAFGITIFLVGHVTKDGQIAGPRVLEHMVDTVLYFEGDRGHHFRILRSVKNRFGPTDEIGVFEMANKGLTEISNPSELFLSQRQDNISGSAVLAGMEGTRPVLVEIQALVSSSNLATPRRAVVGWDSARLAMIIAVLESRCGVEISSNDVYLNVAGGLKINEPAADLAVAAALCSSLTGVPVPSNTVIFGEIGLSGEIRTVNQMDNRLKEAEKLGFKSCLIPERSKKEQKNNAKSENIAITELSKLSELIPFFAE